MNPNLQAQRLLDDIDRLRPILLSSHGDDPEVRSLMRRIVQGLDELRARPFVEPDLLEWINNLFSRLLDAEHGALLKSSRHGGLAAGSRGSLMQHVSEKQRLLMEAQQDIPATHRSIDHCCNLLGQTPEADASMADKGDLMERLLKDHLLNEAGLRLELQQLLEAMRPSLEAMNQMLAHAGEESAELQHARALLEVELPEDVAQARDILQNARKDLLQASDKIVKASASLRDTMTDQLSQLTSLSTKLAEAESEARYDPLTGLANRRRLGEYLGELGKRHYGFLLFDLDHFKQVNDTHGHDVGDEILATIGKMLKNGVRATDLAVRLGGEEFCIVLPDTPLDKTVEIAEKMRHAVAVKPLQTSVGEVPVTISIGVTEHHPAANQAKTFKRADQALYTSKEAGRNRVSIEKAPDRTKAK